MIACGDNAGGCCLEIKFGDIYVLAIEINYAREMIHTLVRLHSFDLLNRERFVVPGNIPSL